MEIKYKFLSTGLILISLITMALLAACMQEILPEENSDNTPEASKDLPEVKNTGGNKEEAAEEMVTEPEIIPISPETVFEIMENGEDYLLVDVRTEEEYNGGHIEDAKLLPVQELEGRLEELPNDRSIILYCRTGRRSRNAAEILIANGFEKVYDMGGINSWTKKGFPVVVKE
ncbi:MAG: rhodanese-like domain-containing protein [Actinomycetota bacterium]